MGPNEPRTALEPNEIISCFVGFPSLFQCFLQELYTVSHDFYRKEILACEDWACVMNSFELQASIRLLHVFGIYS